MPTLNSMNSLGFNTSSDGEWVNSNIETGLYEPFSLFNYGLIDLQMLPTTINGTCTSASLWSLDDGFTQEVCSKCYNDTNLYYFNGKNYTTRTVYSKAPLGNVVWFGKNENNQKFVLIAGDNNVIYNYNLSTRSFTIEVNGDTTLFPNAKGLVFCTHNEYENIVNYCSVYERTDNILEVRGIDGSNKVEWSNAEVFTYESSSIFYKERISGSPIYDFQTKQIQLLIRDSSGDRSSPKIRTFYFEYSDGYGSSINSNYFFPMSIYDVFKDMQLVCVDYSNLDKKPSITPYIFNVTTMEQTNATSQAEKLLWLMGYYDRSRNDAIQYYPSFLYIGDSETFIYNHSRDVDNDARTFVDSGLLTKVVTNKSYINKLNQPSISTLKYFTLNFFFNNKDMIWINCKKNDILYIQPVTMIFIISPCENSSYQNIMDVNTLQINNVTANKLYYEYKVTKDCIISCNKGNIYRAKLSILSEKG